MAIPKVIGTGVQAPHKVDTMEKVEKMETLDHIEEVGSLEVSLDTPVSHIVECDKKGWKVTFADTPGKFKRLTDAELQQLHRVTQAAYLVSERYHQWALDNADTPKPLVSDIRQDARATDRLFVGNKRADLAYSWKRPDEWKGAVAYEGWKVETDSKLDTFRNPVGGAYTVGAKGDTELVLMSRPKSLHEAHLREASEKSDRMRGAIQPQAAAEDRRFFEEGDTRMDPKLRKWKDVEPSGEST